MKITAKTIRDFLYQQSLHVTHAVVAHTHHKTFEQDRVQMARRIESAKKDCRHFRNCLNRELYGNRARRKPSLLQPLLLATLEGSLKNTDRDLTLHYNFAVGNLPAGLSDSEFFAMFRYCWHEKAHQRDNIEFQPISAERGGAVGWIDYITKEAEIKGNMAVWDFENSQIPDAALTAD